MHGSFGLSWARQVRQAACALLVLAVQTTEAVVCPRPTSEPLLSGHKHHKEKSCPDFKDKESQLFCCPSSIEHGSYYCCSQEDMDRLEAAESSRLWKEFLRNYLALLVIAVLVGVCVLVFAVSLLCRRLKACPLHGHSDRNGVVSSAQAASMYRPVDTIPPKLYEAPPPYESAARTAEQGRNDWNCLIENEVNAGRPRVAPPQLSLRHPPDSS